MSEVNMRHCEGMLRTGHQGPTAERLDKIGWALFFIWVGTGFLLDLGWGLGLFGIGVIILGGQFARKLFNVGLEGCWVVCGALFLMGGLWSLFGVTLPLLPILLIAAGIALLISSFARKHQRH